MSKGKVSRWEGPLTLGKRIFAIRKAIGMRQVELAKPELNKGFISLLETDRSQSSVATLVLLARRLGVSVAILVGENKPADDLIRQILLLRNERLRLSQKRQDRKRKVKIGAKIRQIGVRLQQFIVTEP